ncbi:MAG: hypothetical protein SH850_00840, partial [Planctomycetaceae bacterium]|nr:hypothetical protein [Planctomycetaceae bacterium]
MTDKIEIGLQDNTAAGAESAAANLDRIDAASEALAEKLDRLTAVSDEVAAAQEQVVRVVNEETVSFSKLGDTTVTAAAGVATAGMKYAESAERIAFYNKLLATTANAGAAALAGLARAQKVVTETLDFGAEVASRGVAQVTGFGKAHSTALSIITGFSVGMAAYRAAWSATGKTVDDVTGETTTNLDRV